jgi:hypothetical protein
MLIVYSHTTFQMPDSKTLLAIAPNIEKQKILTWLHHIILYSTGSMLKD